MVKNKCVRRIFKSLQDMEGKEQRCPQIMEDGGSQIKSQ